MPSNRNAAQPDGGKAAVAVTTPSGLVYTSIVNGKGPRPTATDSVKVHYRGTFLDGREFDSSYSRTPQVLPLGGLIPCWTEGRSA